MIDYDALKNAKTWPEPFRFAIASGVLKPSEIPLVAADFPALDRPGSFALQSLKYGPAFAALITELESTRFRAAISRLLDIDLENYPTMITLRGQVRRRDGEIHTDSKTKIVTVLLYLNENWEGEGGKLRMLRSATDLSDAVAEISPLAGNLVAFVRADNSFHGHEECNGVRRSIQLNWVSDESVVKAELGRHVRSAWVKRFLG